MELQPPALEKLLSKGRIQYLLDIISDTCLGKVYMGVLNRRREYVAERGVPARCVACSASALAKRCFDSDELDEWLTSMFQGEGSSYLDCRPCKEPVSHYAIKIAGESQEAIGLVIAGPIVDKDSEPAKSDSLGRENHTGIEKLSKPERDFLEGQCKRLSEVLSKEYCTAATAKSVWVAMPFAPEFNDVYAVGILPTLERLGYESRRVDHTAPAKEVMTAIRNGIRSCAFQIADVSGGNPNVMYEVGFARALRKATLLISRDGASGLPFSLRTEPCTLYRPQDIASLCNHIRKIILAWQKEGSIPFH